VTKPLAEPSNQRRIAQNRWGVKGERQKPMASHWVTPDCDAILNPPHTGYGSTFNNGRLAAGDCSIDDPVLQNLWRQPSAPLELFSFRIHFDGSLETKGHLDASGGAVSGSVAVTFPGLNAGEPDYLLAHDQYWHTVITTDDGTTFMIALVFIQASTGIMTITWPAA
jgi:hypothetical protein